MAKRKYQFELNRYYHIYNRGTDKRKIFMDKGDLYYFFNTIIISNSVENISRKYGGKNKKMKEKEEAMKNKNLVEIVAYALLPNHYHFILKEIQPDGISKFMKKLAGSYSNYFNKKYDRSGTLFQGPFKASLLNYDNSLERMSAYVNLNFRHHQINPKKELTKTSLFEYLGEEQGDKVCSQEEIKRIVKEAGGKEKYKKIVNEWSDIFLAEHKGEKDFFE